jgi:methylated-DNA-protein-cysteine methyltransferase-like protein
MKKDKSDLYETIYALVREIPCGRVSSYGAIAKALGLTSGARVVGYALNNCHTTIPEVPAHRVVNRQGLLSGKHHFGDPWQMQKLLEREGVKVKEDRVADFERLFWDPASLV